MNSSAAFGWKVPGYLDLGEIGTGSQGRVVVARSASQEKADQVVAIKYLHSSLLRNERLLTAFREEARALTRVNSPHISQIHDYVETADGAAIIMELVDGQSLRATLDESSKPLTPEAALTILKGSLLGLAASHTVGVIHRDYKPANVIIQGDGRSKLVDFGIAVLSGSGDQSGTPAYMAPEQWEGGPATPATDIYAATCTFFECVTGRLPFPGPNTEAFMYQHVMSDIPIGDVPHALRPLILHGMEKDPGRRLWDAARFVDQLETIAEVEYGSGWEQRGLAALGAAVTVMAATFPLALLGSMAGSGSGAAGSAAAGSASAIGTGSSGALSKLGTVKAISATVSAGVAVTALVWFLWPSDPKIGGVSAASFRISFDRPAQLLGNPNLPTGSIASPWGEWAVKVVPARALPGTVVRISIREKARTPWGLEYTPEGALRCHEPNSEREDAYHHPYSIDLGPGRTSDDRPDGAVWLHSAPKLAQQGLPRSAGIMAVGTRRGGSQDRKYQTEDCSWHFDRKYTVDLKVPDTDHVRPGTYLVSGIEAPGILSIKATVSGRLSDISSEAVGARIEGRLPRLTILPD